MQEIWIKIGLVGADPQLGTLQGRVTTESFFDPTYTGFDLHELINRAIHERSPFKLFDPIIFRAQRQTSGDIMLGALSLAQSMPAIEGKHLNINPANIMWWAPLGKNSDWEQVVISTLTGLDLASGNLKL